jgi:hypothetical protein
LLKENKKVFWLKEMQYAKLKNTQDLGKTTQNEIKNTHEQN